MEDITRANTASQQELQQVKQGIQTVKSEMENSLTLFGRNKENLGQIVETIQGLSKTTRLDDIDDGSCRCFRNTLKNRQFLFSVLTEIRIAYFTLLVLFCCDDKTLIVSF